MSKDKVGSRDMRRAVALFAMLAVVTGGLFAWYASSSPDGLEWSIERAAGSSELDTPATLLHSFSSSIQEKFAPLPDYSFKSETAFENLGTTVSGIIGSIITMMLALGLGMFFRKRNGRQ